MKSLCSSQDLLPQDAGSSLPSEQWLWPSHHAAAGKQVPSGQRTAFPAHCPVNINKGDSWWTQNWALFYWQCSVHLCCSTQVHHEILSGVLRKVLNKLFFGFVSFKEDYKTIIKCGLAQTIEKKHWFRKHISSYHIPLRQNRLCNHCDRRSAALWGCTLGFGTSSQTPNSPVQENSSPHPSRSDTGSVRHSGQTSWRSRRNLGRGNGSVDISMSLVVNRRTKPWGLINGTSLSPFQEPFTFIAHLPTPKMCKCYQYAVWRTQKATWLMTCTIHFIRPIHAVSISITLPHIGDTVTIVTLPLVLAATLQLA